MSTEQQAKNFSIVVEDAADGVTRVAFTLNQGAADESGESGQWVAGYNPNEDEALTAGQAALLNLLQGLEAAFGPGALHELPAEHTPAQAALVNDLFAWDQEDYCECGCKDESYEDMT